MGARAMKHPQPRASNAPSAVVVGLGATGLSVVRHLVRRGERVAVVDDRAEPPALASLRAEFPEVPVTLGRLDARALAAAPRLVVSPGVALSQPAIRAAGEAGVEVLGDIELFAREVPGPVAAVTGSNGKSTVTTLLGEMARAAGLDVRVGGNLMPPALDLLAGAAADLYVLELSSFQLETTWSLAPRAAALLNVSADHLDRYPDLAAYVAAKARVFDGAQAAVVNLDDARVAAVHAGARAVLGFSVEGDPRAFAAPVHHHGAPWLGLGGEPVAAAAALRPAGRHNLANALAAMAMAHALGIGRGAMRDAIGAFRGLAHRCAPVAEHAGVRWIDDSKGTNVGATAAAIGGLGRGRNLVLIAGGLAKGQDFAPLAGPLAEHVHTLVLIGRDAPAIAAVAGPGTACVHAAGMDEAVALAGAAARPGDCVLLSPACASFDLFPGYAARGAAFAAAVRAWCAR